MLNVASEIHVENTICMLQSIYDCIIVSTMARAVIQYMLGEISLLDFVFMSLYIWGNPDIKNRIAIIFPIYLNFV